jgi:hypothetical protein
MKNQNGKFEDLIQLHKDQVLTTFETLLIHELRRINESFDKNVEGGINDMLQRIYGSIDDLNNDLTDEIEELRNLIRHNNQ